MFRTNRSFLLTDIHVSFLDRQVSERFEKNHCLRRYASSVRRRRRTGAWPGNLLNDFPGLPRQADSGGYVGLRDDANETVPVVHNRYSPYPGIHHRIKRRLNVIVRPTYQRLARHKFIEGRIEITAFSHDLEGQVLSVMMPTTAFVSQLSTTGTGPTFLSRISCAA